MKTFLLIFGTLVMVLVILLARFVQRTQSTYLRRRAVEYQAPEVADWFGTTGLDDDIERELPRYLRREFGEFIDEPDALKAADLDYLGAFDEPPGRVHYWRIPARSGESSYAYVEIGADGVCCTGWGGREPGSGEAS